MWCDAMHAHAAQAGRTTALQATVFLALMLAGGVLFFHLLALPMLEAIFRDSLGARIEPVSRWYEWRLVVDANGGGPYAREIDAKEYLFNPMLALAPITLAMGFLVASLVSALLPPRVGLLRKNLEREISQALERLAVQVYGVAVGSAETLTLAERIRSASLEELGALATEYGTSADELILLQRAVQWASGGVRRLFSLPSAVRLYLRNHFTVEYEQAVLGSIYVGAAVLIIIIGLRGLQFIPKERPSLVLFAIALEFVLLIAYAVTLMFSPSQEQPARQSGGLGELFSAAPTVSSPIASVHYAEKLLRMFIAMPPPARSDDAPNREQSH
ncbi:hypothetical protein HRbin20_00383 [bacterium HR20]|nr:hypothetical protein HRbin20_00383 [bacterium HR20]